MIEKVCVIGAGTMGGGIAAHLANLGFRVTLLDTTTHNVVEGLDRAKSAKPPHFFLSDRASQIRLGNTEEHLNWVSECDWVCEAIIENLEAKHNLFARIEPLLRPDAWISTNTSGLQIQLLAAGRGHAFCSRFVGTHFFNPPRYLKLLELIPTTETDPGIVQAMTDFFHTSVGRRVVQAKDTPGFIANRFGMWAMYHAIHVAEKLRLRIEQVDAITGPFLGRPKSGSFRLNDIVGLDVMADIAKNLLARCPDDPFLDTLRTPKTLQHLLDHGWLGEKARQGYYRREGKELLAFDGDTHGYREFQHEDLASIGEGMRFQLPDRLRLSMELRDEVGEFLRHYWPPLLRYADYLKDKISHSPQDFDRVMMWGFGWEMGPFATIDAIGGATLGIEGGPFYKGTTQRSFSGGYVPLRHEPEFAQLADYPILEAADTFRVRDLGDGVVAVGTTTKMGVITPKLVDELTAWVERNDTRFVLTSEAKSFSVGFDLSSFLRLIESSDFRGIDADLLSLQQLGELLGRRRCVSAVFGHSLGGGLELAISCPQVVALAESKIGFPEVKVGLIPAGRGITLCRQRNSHNAKRATEVAVHLVKGIVSDSADHARVLGYLRATDITEYHRDRLITTAKKLALAVEIPPEGPWPSLAGPISGMVDREVGQMVKQGDLTDYDASIGEHLRATFCRPTSYADSIKRERAEFVELCGKALSQARIRHMVQTNKPLRN